MQTLAIIPARGGSKGIPRKNIRLLGGKPLIAHMITQAKMCRSVDRLVVSTDDDEISDIAVQYGAEVIRRPRELSTDTASSEASLLHVIDHLQNEEGYECDILVFLQCTSPLTQAKDIDGAIEALLSGNADTAFSATPSHCFIWKKDADNSAVAVNHNKTKRPLRQDFEPGYVETGAIYVMRTSGFREARFRFFGKTVIYPTPPERFIDIDEHHDLVVAEALMHYGQERRGQELLPEKIEAIVFDFDGVFTDNRVYVMEDGKEAVLCSRGDGMGMSMLKEEGLQLLVISAETNSVVKARCDKLGIECIYGVNEKKSVLMQWLKKKNIDRENVIYVGNDINDTECLQVVGCGIVVKDAYPQAKEMAQIMLSRPGGNGAIRELADLIMSKSRNIGDKK
jgi:YrbI family 3-deoxy-D-manno-octulosonate 8-phosphate phosphatase